MAPPLDDVPPTPLPPLELPEPEHAIDDQRRRRTRGTITNPVALIGLSLGLQAK